MYGLWFVKSARNSRIVEPVEEPFSLSCVSFTLFRNVSFNLEQVSCLLVGSRNRFRSFRGGVRCWLGMPNEMHLTFIWGRFRWRWWGKIRVAASNSGTDQAGKFKDFHQISDFSIFSIRSFVHSLHHHRAGPTRTNSWWCEMLLWSCSANGCKSCPPKTPIPMWLRWLTWTTWRISACSITMAILGFITPFITGKVDWSDYFGLI